MVFRAAQWERKANVILYRQITWTRALVPIVEWVAQALWNSGGKTLGKIPTLPATPHSRQLRTRKTHTVGKCMLTLAGNSQRLADL